MPRHPRKTDFPVSNVRRYLEPGPVVLVSSRRQGQDNVMTLGWHTVLEFTPSLVGLMIAGGNHSFGMIRGSGACVINLPTVDLVDAVVGMHICAIVPTAYGRVISASSHFQWKTAPK